jgi:hypothetical protein
VASKGQRLTFCGVSTHHQNGKAEKKTRDTQDLARTCLIHATRRWPSTINAHLWPYALRLAFESLNKSPTPKHKKTPRELFTGSNIHPKINQDHPFGCPVYALDGHLQNLQKIDKWDPRPRLGAYLGHSPQHAPTVGLILSLKMGLLSPQFHVTYDDLFETTRGVQSPDLPPSLWQQIAGFTTPVSLETPSTITTITKESQVPNEESRIPISQNIEQPSAQPEGVMASNDAPSNHANPEGGALELASKFSL